MTTPDTLANSPYLDLPLRSEAQARAEIAADRRRGFRVIERWDEFRLREIEEIMAGER